MVKDVAATLVAALRVGALRIVVTGMAAEGLEVSVEFFARSLSWYVVSGESPVTV
jgi:hypothetical protein